MSEETPQSIEAEPQAPAPPEEQKKRKKINPRVSGYLNELRVKLNSMVYANPPSFSWTAQRLPPRRLAHP